MPLPTSRPKAVSVVAMFLFLATVISVVVGFSLLFPNQLLDKIWELNRPGAVIFHRMARTSGVFLLLLGTGTFAAARGLLRGKNWAWWFAVALFTINMGGDIVSYILRGDALRSLGGIVVTLIFLLLLLQPRIRRYFDKVAGYQQS